jgi:hypothetical protein
MMKKKIDFLRLIYTFSLSVGPGDHEMVLSVSATKSNPVRMPHSACVSDASVHRPARSCKINLYVSRPALPETAGAIKGWVPVYWVSSRCPERGVSCFFDLHRRPMDQPRPHPLSTPSAPLWAKPRQSAAAEVRRRETESPRLNLCGGSTGSCRQRSETWVFWGETWKWCW